MKRWRAVLTHPVVARLWSPLGRGLVSVLMWHRFSDDGVRGHSSAQLRDLLERLRRDRYRLLPLTEVVEACRTGRQFSERAVACTVDDGYADFGDVAAPIFSEFDCPVTIFTVTGFIDGSCWLWWDQVEYAFLNSERASLSLAVDANRLNGKWSGGGEASAIAGRVSEEIQWLPHERRLAVIDELTHHLEVDIPDAPPAEYSPLTWDQVRTLRQCGFDFGPHTMTHPILSAIAESDVRREIEGSWQRLSEEVADPVPIFCYPHGGPDAFGEREIKAVQVAGLQGAVSTTPKHTNAVDNAYVVPRFACPEDTSSAITIVGGLQKVRTQLRGFRLST